VAAPLGFVLSMCSLLVVLYLDVLVQFIASKDSRLPVCLMSTLNTVRSVLITHQGSLTPGHSLASRNVTPVRLIPRFDRDLVRHGGFSDSTKS